MTNLNGDSGELVERLRENAVSFRQHIVASTCLEAADFIERQASNHAELSEAHEALCRTAKLAQSALQAFGDTEEGVNTAYTTLQLGLDNALPNASKRVAELSERVETLELQLAASESKAEALIAQNLELAALALTDKGGE